MEHESNSQKAIRESLYGQGRIVIDWWDGDPIHRPMTEDEVTERYAKMMGVSKGTIIVARKLLGNKNYKPNF